jgi:hypothetical protein
VSQDPLQFPSTASQASEGHQPGLQAATPGLADEDAATIVQRGVAEELMPTSLEEPRLEQVSAGAQPQPPTATSVLNFVHTGHEKTAMDKIRMGGFDSSSFLSGSAESFSAPQEPEQHMGAYRLAPSTPAAEAPKDHVAVLVQNLVAEADELFASVTSDGNIFDGSGARTSVEGLQSDGSVVETPKSVFPEYDQETPSTPSSSVAGDVLVTTVRDDTSPFVPQDARVSAQARMIMDDHAAKYQDLVARLGAVNLKLTGLNLAGIKVQQRTELTNSVTELVIEIADFGRISEQDVRQKLSKISGMAGEPEERDRIDSPFEDIIGTAQILEHAGLQLEPGQPDCDSEHWRVSCG